MPEKSLREGPETALGKGLLDELVLIVQAEFAEALLRPDGAKAKKSTIARIANSLFENAPGQRKQVAERLMAENIRTGAAFSKEAKSRFDGFMTGGGDRPAFQRKDVLEGLEKLVKPTDDVSEKEAKRHFDGLVKELKKARQAASDELLRHHDGTAHREPGNIANILAALPRPRVPYRRLDLLVDSIECLKTTREIDRDEMLIAGVTEAFPINRVAGEDGLEFEPGPTETGIVNVQSVGKYSRHDHEFFNPPLNHASFNLRRETMPYCVSVGFAMAERDKGGFEEFIGQTEDLLPIIGSGSSEAGLFMSVWTTTLAGTGIGGLIGGPIGALIGAAAGLILGLVIFSIGQLIGRNEDDIFEVNFEPLLMLTEDSLEEWPFYGAARSVDFPLELVGHGGQYVVHCHWEFSDPR